MVRFFGISYKVVYIYEHILEAIVLPTIKIPLYLVRVIKTSYL